MHGRFAKFRIGVNIEATNVGHRQKFDCEITQHTVPNDLSIIRVSMGQIANANVELAAVIHTYSQSVGMPRYQLGGQIVTMRSRKQIVDLGFNFATIYPHVALPQDPFQSQHRILTCG